MSRDSDPEVPSERIALMGGAYGNVPALEACIEDARAQGADRLAFLGDAIGCCGHSDETIALIRSAFDVLVAGNHEQQAASGADTCSCGYDSEEDERISCMAFEYALESLSDANREWLGTWPDRNRLETSAGDVLLCHGSPERTNEFLYDSQVEDDRIAAWIEEFGCRAIACTHTGLPWVRRLYDGFLALNCGVTGKPDHDGDPAVHYALLETRSDYLEAAIRTVYYDHEVWADQLEREGVDEVFVEPLRTGRWTCGVESLPREEKMRAA